MRVVTPAELVKSWRKDAAEFQDLRNGLCIAVPRIQARAYADIVDTLLGLKGPKCWIWSDARGAECPGASLPAAASRLVADTASLPAVYAYHYWTATRVARRGPQGYRADLTRGGLYLRLDHNFDLESGGSVAHTAGVINAFRALLPRLQIVSTDRLPLVEADTDFHEVVPIYGLMRNVPGFPLFSHTRTLQRWWTRSGMPAPGFVYARYSAGNYAPPLLSRRLRVPYVCEYNGSIGWISRNWGEKGLRFERLFMVIEEANLRAADLIVVVSDASKEELLARGFDDAAILVAPNGVDVERFGPSVEGRPIRERYGLGDDETVLGFVGSFGPWHGAEVLAEAFCRLLNARPGSRNRLRLLLVGDGMTLPTVKSILEKGGALDRAVLCGRVPQGDAPAYLAACDILVSPHVPNPDGSRFFGSPTKIFEYKAAGRPIVASRLDQIEDLFRHGETGWLTKPGDANELEQGLGHLLDDASLRKHLGRAARTEAERRHTWCHHAEQILERLSEHNRQGQEVT